MPREAKTIARYGGMCAAPWCRRHSPRFGFDVAVWVLNRFFSTAPKVGDGLVLALADAVVAVAECLVFFGGGSGATIGSEISECAASVAAGASAKAGAAVGRSGCGAATLASFLPIFSFSS